MLLEIHSGAISFVTTLFRSHQLFDYFLCSLFSDVSCMSSYRTNFLLGPLRFSCILSLRVCTGHYFTKSSARDAELPFDTWRPKLADSPSSPWIYSIVSSATSSDADSASAYFSSSDFSELITRIVLWWHAMCSISHALCCRQGGKDPIWWCSNALEEKACFYLSAFIQRRSKVCCLQHIALIRQIRCLKHWLWHMDVNVRAGQSQEE